MQTGRPLFATMWKNFNTVYGNGSLANVGATIGGKVEANIRLGATNPSLGFTNGCAIRMSYSLNHSGVFITNGEWKTSSGSDGRRYIFRVRDLRKFLMQRFGNPDHTSATPSPTVFSGMKGILVFTVDWADASGHATLWDGTMCADHCYFPEASEASLWLLN